MLVLRTYLVDIPCCQFSYINRLQMKLRDLKIVVNKCAYMSLLFTYVHTKSTKESKRITETHWEPSEISKMELFAKIVHGFHLSTIFAKAPSQMFDWILSRPLSQLYLPHLQPILHFHTPWKHQKTVGFLMFSGVIEVEH